MDDYRQRMTDNQADSIAMTKEWNEARQRMSMGWSPPTWDDKTNSWMQTNGTTGESKQINRGMSAMDLMMAQMMMGNPGGPGLNTPPPIDDSGIY